MHCKVALGLCSQRCAVQLLAGEVVVACFVGPRIRGMFAPQCDDACLSARELHLFAEKEYDNFLLLLLCLTIQNL